MCYRVIAALIATVACAAPSQASVVVEEVTPGGGAARAGLHAGDRLLGWRCPAEPGVPTGALDSPFDLDWLATEHRPRGPVEVSGERDGTRFSLTLPAGAWSFRIRPELDGPDLARYQHALPRFDDAPADATQTFELLADRASGRGDHQTAAWLLHRAAARLAAAGHQSTCDRLRQQALAAATAAGDPSLQAWILQYTAEALRGANRLQEAREAHEEALQLRRQLDEESLVVALSLNQLGVLAFVQGDRHRARDLWQQAAAIRERLAPASLVLADTLNNLAVIAAYDGELDRAEALHRRCLAIREQLAPASHDVATSLINLGVAALMRGDLAAHERHQQQALAILEKLAPESADVSVVLYNLGGVALERGDLAAAESYFERALELRERLAPDSLEVAGAADALAVVALRRDQLERAASFNQRALDIRQRLAPENMELAGALATRGQLAIEQGRLAVAEESLERGVALLEHNTGPGSPNLADSLHLLGRVALLRGDLERAQALQQRALAIYHAVAPASNKEAAVLHQLARVSRAQGHEDKALRQLEQALACLESQRERIGGATERLGSFREQHMDIYRDAIDLLLADHREREAFAVLERSRAHAQLAMLAERDLVFSADIPAQLERRRRQVAMEADRVLAQLAELRAPAPDTTASARRGVGGLVPSREGAASPLLARLGELRRQQEAIRAEIRTTSPRLAELTYPRPLDLGGTVALLEPGTVLLAYSVSTSACHLFAVAADGGRLEVHELTTGAARLRTLVEQYCSLLRSPASAPEELTAASQQLGSILLGPAAAMIGGAGRLVVVADGPLHLLPFATLADPADPARMLVQTRPVTAVASATVLARLKQRRTSRAGHHVVVFADPQPEAGHLGPLPGARAEAAAVGRIFGSAATVLLGDQATEPRVARLPRSTSLLHLAVHALVDEQQPMETALVLSAPRRPAPGEDNGLLQVWEIYERVRVDADLVTLSACSTARGQEVWGEGLLGLTQAFHHAGARTVLASLWMVADEATAALMERFYSHLHGGEPSDQALRKAQLELLAAPLVLPGEDGGSRELDARHPFYWAAFQLDGDWR